MVLGWAGRLLDGLGGDATSWGAGWWTGWQGMSLAGGGQAAGQGAGCWLLAGWGGVWRFGLRCGTCPLRRSRLLGRQGLCLLSCIPF